MKKGSFGVQIMIRNALSLLQFRLSVIKTAIQRSQCSSVQNPAIILTTGLNGNALTEKLRKNNRLIIIPEVVLRLKTVKLLSFSIQYSTRNASLARLLMSLA